MLQNLAALKGQSKLTAKQGGCSACPKAYNDAWTDCVYLGFEPRLARKYFRGVGLLVNAPFAAFLKLEMFNGICDVSMCPFDSGISQSAIKQLTRWAHEGMTLKVLFVARLLSNEENPGGFIAFTEHSLRCALEKRATLAVQGRSTQPKNAVRRGKERFCAQMTRFRDPVDRPGVTFIRTSDQGLRRSSVNENHAMRHSRLLASSTDEHRSL